MKIELSISKQSCTVSMSGCSKSFESQCGIMYRNGIN